MKKVYRCPRCGSKNLTSFMGFQTGMKYQCLDCGYIGVLRVEEVENQKIQKSRKRESN